MTLRRGLAIGLVFVLSARPVWAAAPASSPDVSPAQGQPQGQPVSAGVDLLGEVRIHGNYRTPDTEVLRLAGVVVGSALEANIAEVVANRLRRAGRFEAVEVRTRVRSLADDHDIALIIIVTERPGADLLGKMPGPIQRVGSHVMTLPIVDFTDGYGLTYGGRVSFVDMAGKEGRLSVPLTWGGTKRAAIEFDKRLSSGLLSRIQAAASVSSRENPFYHLDDRRSGGSLALTRVVRHALSVDGRLGWNDVRFGGEHVRFMTYGGHLVLDSRANPAFPRNAAYFEAGWDLLDPEHGRRVNMYSAEFRGYLGLVRSSVLVLRGLLEAADGPLPRYEKALLGGMTSLRGFRAGAFAGDSLAATSVELRLPTVSPMHVGQAGFSVFADLGGVCDHGQTLRQVHFARGFGGGWYLNAPMIRLGIDVARGVGAGTRVHVTAGLKL
jgi:hypothetical protein